MTHHDPSEFTHAYRVDTGERVYIPKSHLTVFPGSFRLSKRQQETAVPDFPAVPATDKTKEK